MDSLADRFDGFGTLDSKAGKGFETIVREGREELNERMEERDDALFGE